MSRSEVEDKFIGNALVVLGQAPAYELLETINQIERLTAATQLTRLLQVPEPA